MREKLKSYHTQTAWVIYLLVITGLLLYLPGLRGWLSSVRYLIIWIHDGLGIYLILLAYNYLGLAGAHWRLLGEQYFRKFNLLSVIFIIILWSVSGLLLLLKGYIGPGIVRPSLLVHDLVSWGGVSLILYHTISRLGEVLDHKEKPVYQETESGGRVIDRKTFLRFLGGSVAFIGAFGLVRFLAGGVAGEFRKPLSTLDLKPLPTPLPQSKPPAGGGRKGDFRIYTVTDEPSFNNQNWSFTVNGLVDKPLHYKWADFVKLPRTVQVSNFHCVTGWSVNNVTYEGIKLADMLKAARVKSSAKFVKFYSGDGVYTDSLSISQAGMQDVMLALLMDGQPLSGDFGGPVRLVVPKMYGYKSVKWLKRVELVTEKPQGYWEARGYANDAWVTKKSGPK